MHRSPKHRRIEQLDRRSLKRLAGLYRADFRHLGYKPQSIS